ncbi:hypothetical protein [Pedobacter terrae]|uniref:hypothetical protein n=1 Tax=Pedobacter terrae TaxID=405671 RepID=UPI002FFC1A53
MEVRIGKIISIDKTTGTGIIEDSNFQDIGFSLDSSETALLPGQCVTFVIKFCASGLEASQVKLARV